MKMSGAFFSFGARAVRVECNNEIKPSGQSSKENYSQVSADKAAIIYPSLSTVDKDEID